ncbi:hypothetical protein MCOR02_003261 [Pyricularia oryzae]|uniref:U3 small nucleolar ribonucleoprotein protein MPP10 n=1 Tax=Pyricularia grisea TaxID=148305 RepID=A0ABQ8NQ78_PYRGI|nr:hypothetical protein MCOR01_009036 [Pyricularia oryzae]KAI6299994.1 hypothetical protein MCOR33_004201 [Pyricularia grisea]KAH9439721.1 hypothetical protein MCOR02_003261 [Pyricularia oryzae]KAI6278599.1 hypothetical protein MCOR26_004581 [Pyricularia oryzae]KAI6309299.1 hypothetical protein MCOR30_011354 [Pyricularia oryzae]
MAGAGSTSSSMTSTSHTLTYAPGMAPASTSSELAARQGFLAALEAARRHKFLRPDQSTPKNSLDLAKDTLDAFAGQVCDEQDQRLRDANRKRKRAEMDRSDVLKIRKLHIDGFETGQVWQQTKRIISSALSESHAVLQELEESGEVQDGSDEKASGAKVVEFGEDGFEVGSDDSEEESDASGSASGSDDDEVSGVSEDESELENGIQGSDSEQDVTDGDMEDMGDEDDYEEEEDYEEDGPEEEYVEDPHGLNDGFFSLENFNKQTQWFEDQDARADPNTDVVSDEEDLDWHADPMAQKPKSKADKKEKPSSKSRKSHREEEPPSDLENDDDDDDEQGPTFGDMDLDAPEGASDDEFGENVNTGNDNELTADDIFYKDFFAPPAKKAKKGDNRRNKDYRPKQPREYDVEAAMEGVKRDLFDDMSEGSGSEDELSEVEAGDPKARKSAHERRQAKITEEIRKLEAALVKPKEWTLAGEAAAPERPVNSLLEEDLEFEHVGKPIPVITEEVSESIEEMIKRRIIAQEFDEVIRRLPGSDLPANTRRGLVEVDDTKAKQGLAEIYEEEYVKNANPDTYVSQSDEKLRKEEKEIEQMWKEVSAKLDALSSWHYKPKPAAPSLTVVSDVATVAMEDAQPTTAQGVNGGASMMAPQEVYKAGKETAETGEVVSKSGLPVARQEMSREEKIRRRRREKERIRKSGGGSEGKKPVGKKAQERKQTMSDLRKGGVMVINRQGEIMDVDGNKPKASKAVSSGSFKL